MKRNLSFLLLMLILRFAGLSAQPVVIDEVVAVIGDKRILYSEIEENLIQLKVQGEKIGATTRCEILEQLMIHKLLINQAEIDSILVTDRQVEIEMEQRMSYFVNQMGSEGKNAFNLIRLFLTCSGLSSTC